MAAPWPPSPPLTVGAFAERPPHKKNSRYVTPHRYAAPYLAGTCLLLLLALSPLLNTGCAKLVAPTGGARDTIPPRIVASASTPDLQTQFRPEHIRLTFDEWVQLNNPTTEVTVSPPLARPPKLTLRGKTVTLDLSQEQLRDSATYVISFGKSIQDFTERNTPRNLRFVFSTGRFIDSLQLSGRVIDLLTQQPQADALVMLYDDLSDTVVRTQRPFYYGRTDKQGRFVIPYLKADTFQVIALTEKNPNYRYDEEGEAIAFLTAPVVVHPRSDSLDLLLELFLPRPVLRQLQWKNLAPGYARATFNQPLPPGYTPIRPVPDSADQWYADGDTLHFWYRDTTHLRPIVLPLGSNRTDTVTLRTRAAATAFAERLPKAKLLRPIAKQRQGVINHNPYEPISLTFDRPIAALDTALMLLVEDSTRRLSPVVYVDSLDPRRLRVQHRWPATATSYQLTLLPDAVTLHLGQRNDSLRMTFRTTDRTQYGSITIQLTGRDSSTHYVVELLKDKTVVQSLAVTPDTPLPHTYRGLPTGNYSLRIVEDRNANGRWDPGEYPGRQSERIFQGNAEQLRPDWDLELTFSLEDISQ